MTAFQTFFDVVITEASRMWWFTLLGIALAALIKTYQLDRKARPYVDRVGPWGILIATALGTLSPLCSCGILPIVIPMALSGVPLAPIMALLVASPIMDPTSFVLTWGGVGEALAWWKFGGAVFLSLLAGFGTLALQKSGFLAGNLVRLKPVFTDNGDLASSYDIALANGFKVKTMNVKPRTNKFLFFCDRFMDVAKFVLLWVGIAIVLEGVLNAFIDPNWLTWLTGQNGALSIFVSTAIALPLPTNQIAVIPILAGLIHKGLAQGADLAFLMAGPVTSIPAAVALASIFKPRVLATYLALGLLGSALLGFARMALG